MDDFLNQVEGSANDGRFYYLALMGALTIPDMCGALETANGIAKPQRYKPWFDRHVAVKHLRPDTGLPILTGEDCYNFRCSLLHQGRTKHPNSGYSRILFLEPGVSSNTFHMNVLGDALNIDVRAFCREMVASARDWLQTVQGTEPYETNFNSFVRRYPMGLPPYMNLGLPVIS